MIYNILDTERTKSKDMKDVLIQIRNIINVADAIVLGAGSGLSTSAGFSYSGDRFDRYFRDFVDKYGFSDMYSGGFFPFTSEEEKWAYWSRYVYINRYSPIPEDTYSKLFELIRDKNYFVITTNVDHCFQKSAFDKERLFYTQGDFGLFQCSRPCHKKTYENYGIIREMLLSQGYSFDEDKKLIPLADPSMTVDTKLIPRCPICGEYMSMNLRADDTFVEDDGWRASAKRYAEFIRKNISKKIVFMELGVGMNTPGIIKYNFWNMTREFEKANYICINYDDATYPCDIREKSVSIEGDLDEIIERLGKQLEKMLFIRI